MMYFKNHSYSHSASCPRGQNFVWMLLGVMMAKSVSGLEVLSTNNARVRHIEMDLCMSLCLALLRRGLPTIETNILPTSVVRLSDHRLNHSIQI